MEHLAYQSITAAIAIGVFSYIISLWLRIPAILFYLVAGLAAGPLGLNLIDTNSLGSGLLVLVEITVAIILFEGGLSLTSRSFKSESAAIQRILMVTIPLTGIGAAILARFLLDISWNISVFFGALIVVTGPTVVGSILKSVYLTRRLEILLNWESIWGDVIGVLASAVALQMVNLAPADSVFELGLVFILRIVGGVIIGGISGLVLIKVLDWLSSLRDRALMGIVSIAWALLTFFVSNMALHSSGPLAVAVAGFILSLSKKEYLHDVRHFKEQVSSLFISSMFVMLSAYINPLTYLDRWPMMLIVAFILGVIIRPLAVQIALIKSTVTMNERLFIGFIGPRGIVAVATAAYAALTLTSHHDQMMLVMSLTFAIIFFSGLTSTIFCRPLARILNVAISLYKSGILLVGINPLSSKIADFASKYVPISFLETNTGACTLASTLGHNSICSDILDSDIYEEALEDGFFRLIAITRNDALNELIADRASMHLEPKSIYRVKAVFNQEALNMTSPENYNMAFSLDFCTTKAAALLENHQAKLEVLSPDEIVPKKAIPLLQMMPNDEGLDIVSADKEIEHNTLCFVSEESLVYDPDDEQPPADSD